MLQDLRSALRAARKDLGSTLASFLTLALGIGATTAVYSVVSAVMLHPLPWKESARLVRIFATDSRSSEDEVSMPDYFEWRNHSRSFERLALLQAGQATLSGHGAPERVLTSRVECSLLPLLGAEPAAGRNFTSEENAARAANTALIGWKFWHDHFPGQKGPGERLILDEKPYTVIGVLPRSLELLGAGDVWLPLPFDRALPENGRAFHSYQVLGRLRPGVSLKAANSELAALSRRLAAQFPKTDAGVGARAVPLSESVGTAGRPNTHPVLRTALLMLSGAVVCVLLIACGNVGNIFLARGLSRQRETAIRVCVGAGRMVLLRYFSIEALLLSLPASLAGVGLAAGAVHVVRGLPLVTVPRLEEAAVDWRVCLFAFSAALITALGVGILPALHATRLDLSAALKQSGARTTESGAQQRTRRLFVALQAALTALLLIEAGLLTKSFINSSQIKTSFVPDRLLTVYLSLPEGRYGPHHPEQAGILANALLPRVRALGGVASAALTTDLPLMGTGGGGSVLIAGRSRPAQMWKDPFVLYTAISNRYFETLKTPLIAGRDFGSDLKPDRLSAIVNQTFARRFFASETPIGQRVATQSEHPDWLNIVGVVADVPQNTLEAAPLPELFLPLTDMASSWLALAVRATGDPLSYVKAIQTEVTRADPGVAVFLPRSMQSILDRQNAPRKLETAVVGGFSLIAVLLAAIGSYAVIAHSANRRSNEIGLRMALGASRRQVLLLIMGFGLGPALLGAGIGLAAGFLIARASQSLLFQVSSGDWPTYLIVTLLLLIVSATAAYLPARRAIRKDPWVALREE